MLYAFDQMIALETSMLTLYNNAYSTCSQKVRLVLAEKSLEWEDRQINFSKNEHIAPEYLKLNPNGVVPTLVHDGAVIIDSSVIMAPSCTNVGTTPFGLSFRYSDAMCSLFEKLICRSSHSRLFSASTSRTFWLQVE